MSGLESLSKRDWVKFSALVVLLQTCSGWIKDGLEQAYSGFQWKQQVTFVIKDYPRLNRNIDSFEAVTDTSIKGIRKDVHQLSTEVGNVQIRQREQEAVDTNAEKAMWSYFQNQERLRQHELQNELRRHK